MLSFDGCAFMKLPSAIKPIQLRRSTIPVIILLGTFLLSAIAAYSIKLTATAKDRLRFNNEVQAVEVAIHNHLKTHIALLQAGSGLFAATQPVSLDEFRTFVAHLSVREQYPGVQGIGYARRVRRSQAQALIAQMRQQGLLNFTIRPEDDRAEFYPIIYLEPLDRRNQAAIGYDMFTETVRRQAMERARDTGKPAASGKVVLVQEIDSIKQAGFLIYIPVYNTPEIAPTVAARQAALQGFIYSPFRVEDLMDGIFGSQDSSYIDFAIYDGREINSETLLYSSNPQTLDHQPRLQITKKLDIAGYPWSIIFTSRPELERDSTQQLVPLILMAGTLLGLILFAITRSQIRARSTAERIAAELRLSEQALRESEERFQIFMDRSPASAWITDKYGTVLYANSQYTKMFALPTSEVIGKTVYDLYPLELAQHYLKNIKQVAVKNQALETIESAPRPDGSLGEFLVYKFPIIDIREQLLIGGIAADITESQKIEQQLRTSEIRFRTLVEQSPISIQILSPQGKTLQVNQAFEKLWGLTLENLQDYNILEDYQLVEKGIMPYLKRGFAGEATFLHAIEYDVEESLPGLCSHSRRSRWVQAYIYPVKEDNGKIREVVLIHEDITDRALAEQELQESEARFRTLIEATFDCIVIHERGIILEANQGTSKTFGYPLSEMIGRSIIDFAAPESVDLIQQNALSATEEPYEALGLRKDGTKFSLEITGKAHFYKGRQVRVSALRDISKRKQLEDQLRKRAEELSEANRLKDEFLATLSHELRTPMNAMLGWTQMLRMRKLDEKTFARATETIERNTRSLAQLIEDLLDVSRIITGKLHLSLRPISVIPSIEGAIETVHPAAEAKNISLQIYLDPDVGMVLGDRNRLQQIVWNLLSNAVKFTPEGGEIEIFYQRVQNNAQIRVSDTGQGISPEFLPHVFERFRQADGSSTRSHGGLGLGLAIVRHLVELHGGTVFATSLGIGEGTTFAVNLPLMTVSQTASLSFPTLEPQSPIEESALRGLNLLLVEDEADTRDLIATTLTQYGAELTACHNTRDAFAALLSTHPDLIVSDIGLPGEDGYALIRQVRQWEANQGIRIPAIALTAYARAEDRALAIEAGFQLHIAKPIDMPELVKAILKLLKLEKINPNF